MNLWLCEEMNFIYICMPKLLKENFIQEVLETSRFYKRVCVYDFWYFTHPNMMNDENIVTK